MEVGNKRRRKFEDKPSKRQKTNKRLSNNPTGISKVLKSLKPSIGELMKVLTNEEKKLFSPPKKKGRIHRFRQVVQAMMYEDNFDTKLFSLKEKEWKKGDINIMDHMKTSFILDNFKFVKHFGSTKHKDDTETFFCIEWQIVLKFRRYEKDNFNDFEESCKRGESIINRCTKLKRPELRAIKLDKGNFKKYSKYKCFMIAMNCKGINVDTFTKAVEKLEMEHRKALIKALVSNFDKFFKSCTQDKVVVVDTMLRNFAVKKNLVPLLIDEENFKPKHLVDYEKKSKDKVEAREKLLEDVEKANRMSFMDIKHELMERTKVVIGNKTELRRRKK